MKYKVGDKIFIEFEILDIQPIDPYSECNSECNDCSRLSVCNDAEYIVDKIDYRFEDSDVIPSPITKIEERIATLENWQTTCQPDQELWMKYQMLIDENRLFLKLLKGETE